MQSDIVPEESQKSPMRVGMIFFLISEIFLFLGLFTTYYYLRFYSPSAWPPAGVQLDTGLAIIDSIFLLATSLTIYLALRGIRRGNQKGLAAGLIATFVLGSVSLGITAWEWTHLPFQPWSHAYGSIFYTLTGFHALHVFFGVLLVLALLLRTVRKRFSADRHIAIEVSSYYWYFVDILWIFVFITIFIIR